MKILYLARFLPEEGSTTHMYTLAKGMIERGHEVHMISAGPTSNKGSVSIFNDVINYGLNHHKVRFPINTSYNSLGKIIQLLKYLLVTPRVLFLLLKLRPDIIHVHYPVTSYLAKLYSKLTGVKYVTTHHISGIPKHPLHKKADYVVAISRELKEELQNQFHYTEDQVKLIFNGVSVDRFSQKIDRTDKEKCKRKIGLSGNEVVIGFVGSLSHRKGIDVLIEAIAKLNRDCHVVILGDGELEWVTSLVNDAGLKEKVTFEAFQDPIKFYQTFDVLVLPSRKEGFPLVPLEAMMMGVPTIRSEVEGARDQIEHGVDGYLFRNEDSGDLSEFLNLLIEDVNLREVMGERAREKAVNHFSEKKMIDQLLNVYEIANRKAKQA